MSHLHWLAVHLGADRTAGNSVYYNFWSGFGSDLGEVTLVAALLGVARHHNCHVDRCWSIRTHPVTGTAYRACRKHHPTVPETVTMDDISAAHRAARERNP